MKSIPGLHPRVATLLDVPIPYDFDRGPSVVRSLEDARKGANCVALMHLILGPEIIPQELHCHESYWDKERFRTIDPSQTSLEALDVLYFGWKDLSHRRLSEPLLPITRFIPEYDQTGYMVNAARSPLTHIGIFSGAYTEAGDPLIFHASREAKKATLEPLAHIARNPRYAAVYRVSRFIGNPVLVSNIG